MYYDVFCKYFPYLSITIQPAESWKDVGTYTAYKTDMEMTTCEVWECIIIDVFFAWGTKTSKQTAMKKEVAEG